MHRTETPDPVLIRLDQVGAEVEITVWDEALKRRIRASLLVECPESWCGAMELATGQDGSPDTVFVPPRRYKVSLFSYPCGSKTYFAADKPSLIMEPVAETRSAVELHVDTRLIRATSSYDNPGGEQCRTTAE